MNDIYKPYMRNNKIKRLNFGFTGISIMVLLMFFLTSMSNRNFSTPKNKGGNRSHSVAIDGDGNVYVTGYITNTNNNTDMCVLKYNSAGAQIWTQVNNGPGNGDDKAYAITIDKANNVYITGYSTGVGTMHDITTIKYTPAGSLVWIKTFNGTANHDDESNSIVVDDNDNLYITGFTTSAGTGSDMCTIKYNSDGIQQWVKVYNSSNVSEDKAYAITIDRSSNVYITGFSSSNHNSVLDSANYTTIKYNSSGTQQWVASYNGSGGSTDKAYAITLDGSDHVIVSGSSIGANGLSQFATIQYKSNNGSEKWVRTFSGMGFGSGANAVVAKNDNNVFVTGWCNSNENGNANYATVKYDDDGEQQWVAYYNGGANGDDVAKSIDIDNKGDVYVTGSSKVKGPYGTFNHYATMKYSKKTGSLVWLMTYTGNNYVDEASALAIDDNSGSVVTTGSSMNIFMNFDYATVKYTKAGSQQWVARYSPNSNGEGSSDNIEGIGNSSDLKSSKQSTNITKPTEFRLYQNYPNPFNPSTTIGFDIPEQREVRVVIYDALGKLIYVLADGVFSPGRHEITWNGSDFPSGIYYCKITSEDFVDIKKMILVK